MYVIIVFYCEWNPIDISYYLQNATDRENQHESQDALGGEIPPPSEESLNLETESAYSSLGSSNVLPSDSSSQITLSTLSIPGEEEMIRVSRSFMQLFSRNFFILFCK